MKFTSWITILIALLQTLSFYGLSQDHVRWNEVKILVYTKNGKGYVHDNIPHAVNMIQKLSKEKGFKVDVSDNPSVFTELNLKQYTLLLFASTNNDVFETADQRLAFRRYIEAGGGFVGLHSVVGTERNWKWFKMMLGGTFAWHPPFQSFTIKNLDATHPSMQGVPAIWTKEDECYFMKELYPGVKILMAHELASLDKEDEQKINAHASPFADYYPAVWHHNFDGGIIWITTLGHDKRDYEDNTYINHVWQGMHYVASQRKDLDYRKAYASDFNDPIR